MQLVLPVGRDREDRWTVDPPVTRTDSVQQARQLADAQAAWGAGDIAVHNVLGSDAAIATGPAE
ncbi:hypothetical protein ACFU44_33000 [Nocardia rhizosphaerihabitans]|uniref:hypothetical protein n=1 Tax=Nocardia rhizosphaerihabitans TaxID=1691570 RepID=UPI0036732BD3